MVYSVTKTMKIIFKNFGWLKNKEFTIPNEGLILLHGNNGTGKTTLMRGIAFALYGNMQNVVSTGEKTCCVILEFEGLKITRFVPARLVVELENGEKYEAEAGQSIINKQFGMNYDRFSVACCISQHSLNNSVISMTPNAQLQFVESVVSFGTNHIKNKKEIKKYIQEKSQNLQTTKQKYELTKCKLDTLESTLPKLTPPNGSLEELQNQKSNTTKTITELTKVIHAHKKRLLDVQSEQKIKTERDKKIASLEAEIKILQDHYEPVSKEKLRDLQEELKNISTKLSHLKNISRRDQLYTTARELKKKFLSDVATEFDSLKELILDDEEKVRSELGELDVKKGLYDVYVKDVVVYEAAKKTYDALVVELVEKLSLSKNSGAAAVKKALCSSISDYYVGNCPSCNTLISVSSDNTFHIHTKKRTKSPKTTLSREEAQTYLNKLDGCVVPPKPEVVEYDVLYHTALANRFQASEKSKPRYQELLTLKTSKTWVYPREVVSAYKEVKAVEKLIPKTLEITETEQELREKESNLSMELGGLMKVSAMSESKEKEKVKKIRELNLLKAKSAKCELSDEGGIDAILKTISETETLLVGENSKLVDLDQSITHHTTYAEYLKKTKEVDVIRTACDQERKTYDIAQEEYKAALLLEKRYKEHEFLALEKVVGLINENAKVHVDRLFSDPIVVKLCASKTNLNGETKMQMSTQLDYRCNDIKKVSGGERQKCELAYVLAVNEMLGGRFVFFDECTAYIDEGMQKEILGYVRQWVDDSLVNKLVMFVEHKTIKGKFDEVVELK